MLSLLVIQPIFGLIASLCFSKKIYDSRYIVLYIWLWVILYIAYIFIFISKWPYDNEFCTNEKETDSKLSALYWPWTRNNKAGIYIFYWIFVFLFPSIATSTPIFWIIISLCAFPIARLFTKKNILNESASCYWGPLLALLIVLLNIPHYISKKTYNLYYKIRSKLKL